MELAGFKDGNYRNHSLRATACTRLYKQNQDEQNIKEISGHVSNCVRTYKHTPDSVRMKASSILQSNASCTITKPTENVQVCEKVDRKDIEDFEANPMKIHTPKTHKIESVDGLDGITKQICDVVSSVSDQKQFKKIKVA